jgi:hypothetical protein
MFSRLPIAIAIVLLVFPITRAEEPTQDGKATPSELALEIDVLRTLYYLKATPEQFEAILKLAKGAAAPAKKRKKSKVSAEYRRLMEEVREALAEDDEERVETLEDQLEERTITETPEIDDTVEITDSARKRAPQVLKLLRAPQAATFLGMHAEQIADPSERLREALAKVRGWKLAEWQEHREALGEEIGVLVGGVDREKFVKARDAVIDLLSRARIMKDSEHENKCVELENEAAKITGHVGPTDVLRHFLENALARMLSNPRVESALHARAK